MLTILLQKNLIYLQGVVLGPDVTFNQVARFRMQIDVFLTEHIVLNTLVKNQRPTTYRPFSDDFLDEPDE